MSAGASIVPTFVLGVVVLGLLGVLSLGVYLMTRSSSKDPEGKAGK